MADEWKRFLGNGDRLHMGEHRVQGGSPMNKSPIASEAIYGTLLDDIVRNHLKPGDAVSEVAIGSQFGVSRQPAREALAKLAQLGLVSSGPRRKSRIAPIPLDVVLADLFVRDAIESKLFHHLVSDPNRRLGELTREMSGQYGAVRTNDISALWDLLTKFDKVACQLARAEFLFLQNRMRLPQLDRVRFLSLETSANRVVAENASLVVTLQSGNERALSLELEKRASHRMHDVQQARRKFVQHFVMPVIAAKEDVD